MVNAKEQFKNLFSKSEYAPGSNDVLVMDDLELCKTRPSQRASVPRLSITGNKSKALNFNKMMITDPKFSVFLKGKQIQILYSPGNKMIAISAPNENAQDDTLFNLTKQKYNYSVSIKGVLLAAKIDLNTVKGFYHPEIKRISTPNAPERDYIVFFLDKKIK